MFKKALLLSLFTGSTMTMATADTKAAFDLGSGMFRVLVADVEGKKIQIRYSKMINVALAKDLLGSSDQMLSDVMQQNALEALRELKRCAEEHGATSFKGVATEACRKAKNGELFLNLLRHGSGIDDLKIISQKEEGILGFRTAMAFFPNLDEEKLIAWDIGGGSFQLTAKNGEEYEVYGAPLGNSIVTKVLTEEVRKKTYTNESVIAPITLLECDAFIKSLQDKIPSPPSWLISQLEGATVVALAGTGPFAKIATYTGSDTYTKKQVKGVIEQIAGNPKIDSELVERICLIYAIMEKFGMHEITRKQRVAGNALGLFSAELTESI